MFNDRDAEYNELLAVIVNTIREKKGTDRYNAYKMMFATSPERLLSPAMKTIESFLPIDS